MLRPDSGRERDGVEHGFERGGRQRLDDGVLRGDAERHARHLVGILVFGGTVGTQRQGDEAREALEHLSRERVAPRPRCHRPPVAAMRGCTAVLGARTPAPRGESFLTVMVSALVGVIKTALVMIHEEVLMVDLVVVVVIATIQMPLVLVLVHVLLAPLIVMVVRAVFLMVFFAVRDVVLRVALLVALLAMLLMLLRRARVPLLLVAMLPLILMVVGHLPAQ